jgi:glycosyltransferase involved in cell wall biosynthesis
VGNEVRVAVAHNLPPGGASRALAEQVRHTATEIQAVYSLAGAVAGPSSPSWASVRYPVRVMGTLGSPLGRLNGAINVLNLKAVNQAFRLMARDIDSAGYDVVLVHPCRVSQAPAVLRYLRTPTVYYCHEPFRAMHEAAIKGGPFLPILDPLRGLYSRLATDAEFKSLRRATVVLCNSHYTREYLLRTYGVDSVVNYPGVRTEVFKPLATVKESYVLSVGRLSPMKGHEFIIESLATITKDRRPDLHVVCGPSPREEDVRYLCQFAKRLGVSLTVHTGISDDELAGLYSFAAATLAAPVMEPFGLVALESMSCGTPVVAVAEGGIRETVVDSVTGFLTPRDSRQFGDAVLKVLTDTEMASAMGMSARREVEKKWSWEGSVRQLDSILTKAAGMKT